MARNPERYLHSPKAQLGWSPGSYPFPTATEVSGCVSGVGQQNENSNSVVARITTHRAPVWPNCLCCPFNLKDPAVLQPYVWVVQQRGPDWIEEFRAARGKCGTKNSQPDKVIRTQMVRDVSWGQGRRRWWGKNRVIR